MTTQRHKGSAGPSHRKDPRHGTKRGKLTPKQARFVFEYLIDENAEAAAVRAGYAASTKYGHVLMRMPLVKAAIDAAQRRVLHKLELTATKTLTDIDRLSSLAEISGEYTAALRGRELIGKHQRLFAEKVELSTPDGPVEFTEIRRTIVRPASPKP